MLNTLAAERALLAELEDKILSLNQSLILLRQEKSAVQKRLNTYVYPVLTLPNEITTEIFLHTLPPYPVGPPLVGPESPIVLTHVCRLWREIALATPKLWRAMTLFGNSPGPVGKPDSLWLNRAGRYPLSLYFDDFQNWGAHELESIVPHVARCEYLQLRLSCTSSIVSPPVLEIQLPLLRHLDLESDYGFPRVVEIHASSAPLLRFVALDNLSIEFFVLPWAQLTSLWLHGATLENCADILRQATSLTDCCLDIDGWGEAYIAEPLITLPHLKSLTLLGDTVMMVCIESFMVPALSTLDVNEIVLGTNPVDTLVSFVSESGCKLKRLCIRDSERSMDESYHAAFPSIVTFSDEDVNLDTPSFWRRCE